jgi:hypothetical protein
MNETFGSSIGISPFHLNSVNILLNVLREGGSPLADDKIPAQNTGALWTTAEPPQVPVKQNSHEFESDLPRCGAPSWVEPRLRARVQ